MLSYKTAMALRQTTKSIYLTPLLFGSQNTGAIKPDYLISFSPSSFFWYLRIDCQEITAQISRLSPKFQKTYIQIK